LCMKKAIPFTFNFLYFAGFASFIPFIVLYYQELGFSGAQISLLTGLPPLVTLFFSPFWTNLADSTGRHKQIMSVGIIITIMVTAIFPLLQSFALVMLFILAFNIFVSPLTSFADSATMTMLAGEKEMYGRIRLGGTIGWGLAAPIAGALIKVYGLNVAFWICASMLLIGLFVSQGFSFGKHEPAATKGRVRDLLSQRRWILFLVLAFFGGIAFASTAAFFSPYMIELGGDEFDVGIALLVATLTEIPVFFFGNRLLGKFKSRGLLYLALIITGVRSLLFAVSNAPIFAILAQLLNGFTFPAMWIAGVSYADENAPAGLKSTAQGLFGAMTFGFGSAVGGLIGGILLEGIGGRALFMIYGVIVLLSVAIILLIEKRTAKNL
jgi:MFS transporter, PPP family, 3-phenylpropionic acid transporter